jgi:hypothetical protein
LISNAHLLEFITKRKSGESKYTPNRGKIMVDYSGKIDLPHTIAYMYTTTRAYTVYVGNLRIQDVMLYKKRTSRDLKKDLMVNTLPLW